MIKGRSHIQPAKPLRGRSLPSAPLDPLHDIKLQAALSDLLGTAPADIRDEADPEPAAKPVPSNPASYGEDRWPPAVKRMELMDSLPPCIRAVVHEYGMAIIDWDKYRAAIRKAGAEAVARALAEKGRKRIFNMQFEKEFE